MKKEERQLTWIDGLKAFAIIGILLNHFVESFGSFPWFSHPSSDWPDFAVRMSTLFPSDGPLSWRIIQFLGWLGDMGPGIFILASGLTLTLSFLRNPQKPFDFYKNRFIRIYPLYILIQFIVILSAKYLFNWHIHIFSAWTFLSLTGLRFTDSLFFFINPSWWFIWLIIQMYFFFPFLIHLLKKRGIAFFIWITLGITAISRIAGVLDLTYTHNLYAWMTGLFAGTRLFEFTIGMVLGFSIYNNKKWLTEFLAEKYKVLLVSILIYLSGFVCSWTLWGSVVSYILITLGLSGIFYSVYYLIVVKFNNINRALIWTGKNSFAVFLLHQPFMMYVSSKVTGIQKGFALAGVILASFIFGYFIEKLVIILVKKTQKSWDSIRSIVERKESSLLLAAVMLSTLALCTVYIFKNIGFRYIISCRLFLLFMVLLTSLRFIISGFRNDTFLNRLIYSFMFISAVFVLIDPNWYKAYPIIILLSSAILFLTLRLNKYISILISICCIFAGIVLVEKYLRLNDPVEILKWGEYPALQIDDETIYSLIPNKTTHLKYNNYDYYIKTNSLGFTSPEIDLSKKGQNELRIMVLGDAFSMPEGLNFEYSYPSLLEKSLRQRYPQYSINIINAGVTGYGPNEEYAQLRKFIDTIKPDIVIDQFFINDFEDINVNKAERLSGIGFYVDNSNMEKYIGNTQLPTHISQFAQKFTGITDKSLLYNKSLLYLYEKNSSFYSDTVIRKIRKYLQETKDLCTSHNSDLIVMYVPSQIVVSAPNQISYYPYNIDLSDSTVFNFSKASEIVQKTCSDFKIDFIDVTECLRSYKNQPVYYRESWHWNKDGHQAVSGFLEEFLDKKELFPGSRTNIGKL